MPERTKNMNINKQSKMGSVILLLSANDYAEASSRFLCCFLTFPTEKYLLKVINKNNKSFYIQYVQS